MDTDRHGPTVFRVEKVFDICPGYLEVEATISIEVCKTVSASINDLDPKKAVQEKLEPSRNESPDPCKLNQTEYSKVRASPLKPKYQIICSENGSTHDGIGKSPEQHETYTSAQQDDTLMSSKDRPTQESDRCRDELIFDLKIYKDRLEERFDNNEYPVIRKYIRDPRNGIINMIVDAMANIEAHVLNGHVKNNQKMKLEEILVDLRKIIGPLRREPLTYGECKDIQKCLSMAANYASEC